VFLPQLEIKIKKKNKKVDPEKLIAMRIVDSYRKMFDYLDYKPVDNLLTAVELSEAFKDFNWPKAAPDVSDDLEYSKLVISRYDTTEKKFFKLFGIL